MMKGAIDGKLARNNYQIEVKIYGTTAEDCAAMLQTFIDELQQGDPANFCTVNSGVLSHAGGYMVMQHDPGFLFGERGSAFKALLRKKFPGYDPGAGREDEERNS